MESPEEKRREELERSLVAQLDEWLGSPQGVLLRRLLAKWRAEMLDRWASANLENREEELRLQGQTLFCTGLLERWNGQALVEEMKMKEMFDE